MIHFCNQFFLWYLVWINCYSMWNAVVQIDSEPSNSVMICWCNESWIRPYTTFNLSFQLFSWVNFHSVDSAGFLTVNFKFNSKTTSSALWIMRAPVRALIHDSIFSMPWSLDNFTLKSFMTNMVQYSAVWCGSSNNEGISRCREASLSS